jgi:hypothetical protein
VSSAADAGPAARSGLPRLAVLVACAVVALAALSGTAESETVRARAPGDIPSDCSRDVTHDLADWFDRAPNGTTLSLAPSGCYEVDGTLVLEGRKDLTIDGQGATFRVDTPGGLNRVCLLFLGGSDITIRDLGVHGANPKAGPTDAAYDVSREAQHAFAFRGTDGVVLDHVSAMDTFGDFVYIGNDADTGELSNDVTVRDSHFDGSGRQGISITGARNVTITGNEIRNVARSMFDIEPNAEDGGAEHIVISDNVTGAAKNFWMASKGATDNITDVTIKDNVARGGVTGGLIWVYGVLPDYRGPYTITGNHFAFSGATTDEESKGAFFFARCRDVSLTDNVVRFPKGTSLPAVELRDSKDVTVGSDNVFRGSGRRILDTSPAFPTPDQRR